MITLAISILISAAILRSHYCKDIPNHSKQVFIIPLIAMITLLLIWIITPIAYWQTTPYNDTQSVTVKPDVITNIPIGTVTTASIDFYDTTKDRSQAPITAFHTKGVPTQIRTHNTSGTLIHHKVSITHPKTTLWLFGIYKQDKTILIEYK